MTATTDSELAELFAAIDPTYFHPHPLTPEGAADIARYEGRDVYLVLRDEGRPVAYGFLRGWDEGYEVPSLGIAVRTDAQGHGFGRALMAQLHDAARKRGARQIRLRVHPDNVPARRLYESLGYQDAGVERGEILMFCELPARPIERSSR